MRTADDGVHAREGKAAFPQGIAAFIFQTRPRRRKKRRYAAQSSMMARMWVCPACNQIVPNPVNRKCPNGHALSELALLGFTTEKPLGPAFIRGFLFSAGIAALVAFSGAFVPKDEVLNMLGYTLFALGAIGVFIIWQGFKWKRRGGAVARLVPRAVGTGLGCLIAGGGLFAVGMALGLIH